MTKHQEMQRMIRWYKEETGKTEVEMHDVARFAHSKGFPMPAPIDAIDRLAREFSRAAREEVRQDTRTGRPYRANHNYSVWHGDEQMVLWIDIDEAPRGPMHKSLVKRREQMVGDAVQLSFDMEHWNSIHADEEPIELPLDFTDDVEWRKNGPDEEAS